jgi:hypothetical protein
VSIILPLAKNSFKISPAKYFFLSPWVHFLNLQGEILKEFFAWGKAKLRYFAGVKNYLSFLKIKIQI